jgi:nucleoid-associated protein YgaU
MSAQTKYQSVINLSNNLGIKGASVKEENGVLKMAGTVHTQYEKNEIWNAIKAIGGDNPADIQADIKTETNDYYAKYTVVKGDTLGKISKHFYEEAGKYMLIFNANRDILSDPNLIEVGQVLTIPFEQ